MITYLFIGLFVGVINTIYKSYLTDDGKPVKTPPSILTFAVATVVWPLAIILMYLNWKKLYGR